MKLKQRIKSFVSAEVYLLRLIMKLNGIAGIIVFVITILGDIYPLIATYVGALILDELVKIVQEGLVGSTIYFLILLELGLKILNVTLNSISTIIEAHIENKASLYLDIQIMHKISEMDCAYFDNPKNWDAIGIAETSKREIADEIYGSRNFVSAVIAFSMSITAFLMQAPILGILFLATYIPGVIIENKVRSSVYSFSIQNIPETREKDYYRSILTSKDTAKDVRLYGLQDFFTEKYHTLWKKIKKERFKLFKNNSLKSFGAIIIKYFGSVAIIVYSVISVINHSISFGQMSWYIGISTIVGVNFGSLLLGVVMQVKYTVPQVNLFRSFMSYKNNQTYGNVVRHSDVPRIKFDNVTFTYPNSDKPALKNISFCIEPGEKIGLVGINGAGKTTLIKLLLRLYEPQSGCIYIDDHPLSELSNEEYCKLFSVCFQDVTGYQLSARENIALSDLSRMYDDNDLHNAVEAAGADFTGELNKGLDTVLSRNLDEEGYEPSGGQWQKIAMARAFFSNSPVVILDEPSSALDPVAEDRIFKSFKQLCEKKSGILISHRLSSNLLVDRILLIEDGEIVEMGTHKELIKNNGRYAELFNMQAEKYRSQEGKDNEKD